MAEYTEIKVFQNSGLDTDSAPENVAPNDVINRINMRVSGTSEQQETYGTNIESNTELSGVLQPGINNIIGGGEFDDTGQITPFRYNTGGYSQILLYNYNTNSYDVIYTDLTDSGNIPLLPLNPQNEVLAFLVNRTYLVWFAKGLEVGYTNLTTLASGGYGSTLLWEDLSLLKPQCLIPPAGTYGSDLGQPANYLYGYLPQFSVQYVNADFNYSAWSTWSKRIVPYQQNTPIGGADVTQNNYIIVSVNIGSIRATTINIACRFGLNIFNIIKSVDRSYVVALPNTAVDVATEVYEAYDPSTNLYSFAFYNNTQVIPVDPTETDLTYDYIWPSNAGVLINGNIIGLGDFTTLYARPSIPVQIGGVGYNPNITIPASSLPNRLSPDGDTVGSSGSGLGNHKRLMSISFHGTPHTGDIIVIITADIRNASAIHNYSYTVPSSQDGNLDAVAASIAAKLSGSYVDNGGFITITFSDSPYYGLQTYSIQLFFSGATVANSIPTIPDNTNGQLALSIRDKKGRFFPLVTGNDYFWTSPSYAQVNGNAVKLSWLITNPVAPEGAVDYQWLITKPPINNIVETIATILVFKSGWNAKTNSPALAVNTGTVGSTYQITTPDSPDDSAYTNLGNNAAYNTGDYLVYNGQSWDVIDKLFGNLTDNSILGLSLNPLKVFNDTYATQGVTTNLAYDFAPGDRCTLHYWIDGSGVINYFNSPCIDLAVLGYDAAHYLLKVENSAAFTFTDGHIEYNGNQIDVRNIYLRIYSPAPNNQTSSTTQQTTAFYEIGERFTITNGMFDVLSGSLYDGGAYYKTRQFDDGLMPYANPPIAVLATDLNYSDFYASQFYSFGRVRTYMDELPQTERKASIITSQPYIQGSQINGLTRFYQANIYGDGNGETSSSKGAIQFMWQRGPELVVGQEDGIFYIPVNEAYTVLNDEQTGQSISSKLLNNGRYATENVGIGLAKESFCTRYNRAFFISPQNSEPYEIDVEAGIRPISGKMSKFFKSLIQLSYSQGKKLRQFYNNYYEEVVLCIQAESGMVIYIPFSLLDWQPDNNYVISPGDITATPNGAHCTASFNSMTGEVTYTPASNYVGNDSATFTFTVDGNPITVNNCLQWTAGSSAVNSFSFTPLTDQPLSTLLYSNTILVIGNTIPAAISISFGGEYSINGGSWVSSAGTVNSGDVVQVRQTSSASNLTTTTVTLTIDIQSAEFSVTTQDTPPPETVDLTPNITSTSIGGDMHCEFDLDATLTDEITITYGIQGSNGGIYDIIPYGATTVIPIGDLSTADIHTEFEPGTTNIIFTYTVTPNPAGGVTVDYTSPYNVEI